MNNKLIFVANSQMFFSGCSRYPQGVWRQNGLLRHPDGVGYGQLIWEQLADFDPACGDDSGACDWDHPIEFKLHEGCGYDFDGEYVETRAPSAEQWWQMAVKDGCVELSPIWSDIWLCKDDENNPFESPFYIHDDIGNGCAVKGYEDFIDTIEELDRYLKPIKVESDEDQP